MDDSLLSMLSTLLTYSGRPWVMETEKGLVVPKAVAPGRVAVAAMARFTAENFMMFAKRRSVLLFH